MAVPDPPFSTPRIMKVLEPSAGHYEVIVRMDPTLASKFPDKPFGTAITEIGLAAKDTAKYAGYTLVSIEPADKGGKDHYWIFQKLDGPAWTTTSKSKDNLTPQKYRSQTVVVKTEQEVDPGTAPTALAGDLVSSVVTQTPNTGKAVLSEVTETIAENSAALEGQQFAPDGTLLATSEDLVLDGTSADKSVNVAQSTVDPIGNGKSVRQTSTAKKRDTSDATVDGWPNKQKKSKGVENLTPQKYRTQVISSVTTSQVELSAADVDNIPDPAAPVYPQTAIEHEKVNDYRYEKRVITEEIDASAVVMASPSLEDQMYVTTEILVAEGTAPDFGSGVLSSEVSAIGNGKAIKTTKSAISALTNLTTWTVGHEVFTDSTLGDQNVIPAKFRSLSTLRIWRFKSEGAIPITPAIGAGTGIYSGYTIIERSLKHLRENASSKLWDVVVVGISDTTGNLVSYDIGDGAQRVTVTESLLAAMPLPLPSNSATDKYELMSLGNGMVLQVLKSQAVFPSTSFSAERPDTVPQKFRVAIPSKTEEKTVIGEATSPSISTGELSKSEQQLTKFTKRTQKTSRDATSLPKSLTQTVTTNDGLKAQITETLQQGDTTETPTALISIESDAMGDGTYLVKKTVLNEVFPEYKKSAERPDPLPAKFRIASPTQSSSKVEIGKIDAPVTLASGELSKSEDQITVHKKRVTTTTRVETPPPSLKGSTITRDGQVATVTESVVNDGDTVAPSATTIDGSVETLGNGKSIKRVVTVPSVFPNQEVSATKDEAIPAKFKVGSVTTTTSVSEAGQPSATVGLGNNEIARSESAISMFVKRVSTTKRTGDAKTLTGSQLVSAYGGGVATVTETLGEGGTADAGFNVISSEVVALGGGKTLTQTVKMTPTGSMSGQNYNQELDLDLPFTEKYVQAGQVPAKSDITPVDQWRSKVRTYNLNAIQTKLSAIHITYPSEDTIQLPDVLTRISVLATRTKSVGDGVSWGDSWSYAFDSSVVVAADLSYDIKEGYRGPVPSEVHVFFLKQENSGPKSISSKVNAQQWPRYDPQSSRVVISGNGLSKKRSRSASTSGGSLAQSGGVQAFTNVAVVPATIHAEMPIEITYKDIEASPTPLGDKLDSILDMQMTRALGNLRKENGDKLNEQERQVLRDQLKPDQDNLEIEFEDVEVEVEPKELPASDIAQIKDGRYLKSSSVAFYGYGMMKVTAVVVIVGGDATDGYNSTIQKS